MHRWPEQQQYHTSNKGTRPASKHSRPERTKETFEMVRRDRNTAAGLSNQVPPHSVARARSIVHHQSITSDTQAGRGGSEGGADKIRTIQGHLTAVAELQLVDPISSNCIWNWCFAIQLPCQRSNSSLTSSTSPPSAKICDW